MKFEIRYEYQGGNHFPYIAYLYGEKGERLIVLSSKVSFGEARSEAREKITQIINQPQVEVPESEVIEV